MANQHAANAMTGDAANAGIFAKLSAELCDDGSRVDFRFDGKPSDGCAVDRQTR